MEKYKINSTRKFNFLIFFSISACLQFDYLFFNINFAFPFVAAIICYFYIIILEKFSKLNFCLLIGFLCILLVYVLAFSDQATVESIRRSIVYYGYVGLAIFVISELLNNTSLQEVGAVIKAVIFAGVLVVIVETIFRFWMPTLDLREIGDEQIGVGLSNEVSLSEFIIEQYFYTYKYSSIMFFDSNFVAIFLIPIIILNLFYIDRVGKSLGLVGALVVSFILMALTLSRSGIIVGLLILIANFIRSMYYRNRLATVAGVIILILFFLPLSIQYFDVFVSDGSFASKIQIFKSLSTLFHHDVLNILFGFGVEKGGYIYSYESGAYAHALIPLILGQFGLIGLALYLVIFFRLSYISGFYGWLLFIGIFVAGFSLADPMQISIYLSFLLMMRYVLIESKGKLKS